MKLFLKIAIRPLAAGSVLMIVLASGSANAETTFYGSPRVSAGLTWNDHLDSNIQRTHQDALASGTASNVTTTADDSAYTSQIAFLFAIKGYKTFGNSAHGRGSGYPFVNVHYGKTDPFKGSVSGLLNTGNQFDIRARTRIETWGLDVGWEQPLSNKFNLSASLGYMHVEANDRGSAFEITPAGVRTLVGRFNSRDSDDTINGSLSLGYRFMDPKDNPFRLGFETRFEYRWTFDDVLDSDESISAINFQAGVSYSF